MTPLLRYFSLRYARKRPFRVFLSMMAVTLGVALYVSSDTSNYSAEAAFRSANDKLKGNAQLQVVRDHIIGVETDALKKIDAVPGVKSAPILQVSVTLPEHPDEGNMLVLGLDFAREASFRLWNVAEGPEGATGDGGVNKLAFALGNGIVITKSFAARQKLSIGGHFIIDTPGGKQKVTVGAIIADEGPAQVFGGAVSVMDLRTAQRLFKREGRADRIELIVEGEIEAKAQALRAALGPEYIVEEPPRRNALMDDAMGRVKALMGISMVAILVAVFIIYNSVSISVVERIKEIGTLRAMGATRAQIFGVILAEWSVIGVLGSAVGIAGGYWLANALIKMTATEINRMIPVVSITHAEMPARALPIGVMLGIATTLAAAYFPARAAMQVSPIGLMRQSTYRLKAASGYLTLFWVGAACITLSTFVWWGWVDFWYAGLVSALLGFLGDALALPQLTLWASRAMRPLLKHYRVEAMMAADNTSKFPQRTALTVIALAGALAMMVSASSIVQSFKVRAETWLNASLPFDLSVNATDMTQSLFSTATFPEDLIPAIQGVEGVQFAYGVRAAFQEYGGRTIMLIAPDLAGFDEMHRQRDQKNYIPDTALPELLSGRGVAVSENFAAIHGIKENDTIELSTLQGPRKFKVLGLREDYTWPQGGIFMERAIYRELWKDSGLTYLDIKYKPGADPKAVKHAVAETIKGNYSLFLYEVKDLIKISNDTLDQSLKFTTVQVAVAMIIGFLGIVNTLLISVMQRMREIGLLRAVGMTRGQVVVMVVIESVFLAALAAALGVGLGLLGAKWPLAIHVFQLTGFIMPLAVPWGWIWVAVGGALAIGFLASFIPARAAASVNVLDAIGYE